MSNLPHNDALLAAAKTRSFSDPAYFLRFFLSHWFPSDLPPFHLGLLALITGKVAFLDNYPDAHDFLLQHFRYEGDPRDPSDKGTPVFVKNDEGHICMVAPNENSNWIIPRGFSKTTLVKGAYTYLAVVDSTTFCVFISASAAHAETQILDVKTELETNAKIREVYGNQVPSRSDTEKWTAKELHLRHGAILIAKGRGGQIRGLTHQGRRPNKICLDDIEDEESIATQAQREKTKNWFYGSVVPAGQIMEGARGEEWAQDPLQIINLGTLLGPECLVVDLSRNETFSTVKFGAKVDKDTMLWPYKMPIHTYEKMRRSYRSNGQLGHFAKEYDSEIRVDEDALFPALYHYVPVAMSDLVQRSLALDPAISDSANADAAALVVAGRHTNGRLWFLDEWGGVGKTPSEKIEALFEYHLRWQTELNGIEAVAYQAALLHLAREEMARRQFFFNITPIRPGRTETKIQRITNTLSPRYKNGYISHFRPLPMLEADLTDWPNGRKDFPDAAAMALNLLGETAGLAMDGALEDLPAFTPENIPAAFHRSGNYILKDSSRLRRLTPATNPRY